MKLRKIVYVLIIMLLMLSILIASLNYKIYARDNYAYSASSYTTKQNIANQTISDTRYFMGKAGYRTGGNIDPSKQTLWENLYADVQIFLSHGDWDRITFADTGILAGASQNWIGIDHIGTDDVHWDADTILVLYTSCYGSKDNNVNGLAGKTAYRGADIVIGFRDKIHDYSAMLWNNAFMSELANGKGIKEALDKANSLPYPDNGIKCATLWHHGNENIKIGKYRSSAKSYTNEINNTNNILKLNKNKQAKISDNINEISKFIRNYDETFNEENYVITVTEGVNEVNVTNGEVKDDEKIIDYQLKIGDYVTNSGYCIKINDGVVTAIYDNTQVAKSEKLKLQNNRNEFTSNISNEQIKFFKDESMKKVKNENKNAIITKQEHKFYYDVNADIKYIIISTSVETQEPDGGKTYGIAEEIYEI